MKRSPPKHTPSQQNNQNTGVTQTAVWAAPLPPPSVLESYNQVVERGAERIFLAFEAEGEHRRGQEKTDQRMFWANAILGKVFALMFVLSVMAVTAFAVYLNQPWLAAFLGTTTLAAVVGAFIEVQRRK